MHPTKEIKDELLITEYNVKFSKMLHSISDSTKSVIRKSKELNDLYDLFLDFIIDNSQKLDYKEAKKKEKLFNNE